MAKIQVSTVEMKSNAQVIVLNANFVSRVTKAFCTMEEMYADFGVDYTETVPVARVHQFTGSTFSLLQDIVNAFEEEKEDDYRKNLPTV